MSYTLWRNSTLLGELVRQFKSSSPYYTVGFFACTADFQDIGAMEQVWLPEWPNGPIVQPRYAVGAAPDEPLHGCAPMESSNEIPEPVPQEDVLVIRDETGAVVDTRDITLTASPGVDERVVAAYAERGEVVTMWTLAFIRRSAPMNGSYSATMV